MYEITKDFHFSYSHQLEGLPDTHPCSRLHGHNGIIRLHLMANTLDTTGFVIDYRNLDEFKQWVDDTFDHHHLNNRVPFNPTSEHLAHYVYNTARNKFGLPVAAVSWSETPKTWATYTPEQEG